MTKIILTGASGTRSCPLLVLRLAGIRWPLVRELAIPRLIGNLTLSVRDRKVPSFGAFRPNLEV